MQTFDHLHIALTRYLFQTQTEVENMNHLLVIGDVIEDTPGLPPHQRTRSASLRCGQGGADSTEALEASALATILRQWAAGDEMLREIATTTRKTARSTTRATLAHRAGADSPAQKEGARAMENGERCQRNALWAVVSQASRLGLS